MNTVELLSSAPGGKPLVLQSVAVGAAAITLRIGEEEACVPCDLLVKAAKLLASHWGPLITTSANGDVKLVGNWPPEV